MKEKKKHVLKIIDEYNENKNVEIKVANIISRNITLLKSNVLPFSGIDICKIC